MWTPGQDDGFYVSPHHSHAFLEIRDNQTLFDEGSQTFADADTFPLCEKHKEFGKLRVVIRSAAILHTNYFRRHTGGQVLLLALRTH